jgi:integrase
MRKTFGYHMYKRSGRDIALVQELLNHGSPRQTLRYIGISQEEKDEAYLDLNL